MDIGMIKKHAESPTFSYLTLTEFSGSGSVRYNS